MEELKDIKEIEELDVSEQPPFCYIDSLGNLYRLKSKNIESSRSDLIRITVDELEEYIQNPSSKPYPVNK